ncbi:hypothetical protein DW228_05910 [Bacteroides fragilis]|uniref:Uncharacterized protein n=1 Tax=Bacteroides fragilis TaxID=817 RepID=A0A396C199_BACFG|nr:hypothetical protein [Bacteroides fragilis]RHH14331.1 hypothetical protein DW228_05910 [Bacteroides fragilis]
MKEYVAETGGRYTYADDILNLQELALSMNCIFDGCSNFIVSGCEKSGGSLTPGYVWINGKIRYFEGCASVTFPYYIYERDTVDTVTYANEINKKGRNNYLCSGSTVLPDIPDSTTGVVPQFIELRKEYAPRFIDRFFGKYAVLLETPFTRQTIRKDLIITGNLSVDKSLESKTALSVLNPTSGHVLKGLVKGTGDASLGVYFNGLLVNEILLSVDGSFRLMKQEQELARIDSSGLTVLQTLSATTKSGSVLLSGNSIINYDDVTDDGAIEINPRGANNENTKYRNLNVYDGKQNSVPLFQVIGKDKKVNVNGFLCVRNTESQITLSSSAYLKDNPLLKSIVVWSDSAGERMAEIGFTSTENLDLHVSNKIANIILSPAGYVNVEGDLKVNGVSLSQAYVSLSDYTASLKKKVDAVSGKGLSTEDFTTTLKKKLDAISASSIEAGGTGFVTSSDVAEALKKKLAVSNNLSDVTNKSSARENLDIYSKGEAKGVFLQISGKLLELVSLTADEVNGLSAEQAAALKAEKQAAIRMNLDAEKKGTGNLKLVKTSNLSDLGDKGQARKNLSVYSAAEVDKLLDGKLGIDAAYNGVNFTDDMKRKLESIKGGSFAFTDDSGTSHAEVEGFVTTSQVKKELGKKAERLLSGYSDSEKGSIASNINVYNKGESDKKYTAVASLFQDYITYLVSQGKSTTEAQKALRDKLDVLSKTDITNTYLRKDGKLSDLSLSDNASKKSVCQKIGAAYAEEYQTKITDTGWLQMNNSGSGTDSRRLFVRQIGNIVSIQGILNTARRDGDHWGGTVAIIPNQVSPPRYAVRTTLCNWNDDTKYNRGVTFVISGNSRNIIIYESGFYNVDTEVNFSYMI